MPATIAAASDSDDGPAIGSDRPQKNGSTTSAPSTSPTAPTTIAEPSRFSAAARAASLAVVLLSVFVIARPFLPCRQPVAGTAAVTAAALRPGRNPATTAPMMATTIRGTIAAT